ncbi:hypothetical protein ACFFWB_27075 [Flavobacterium procerum]|uniref:hypothetical protein n=1 Tax=Flavobacterium procerum TaxID=1455569 RepID=UPI0035EEAA52
MRSKRGAQKKPGNLNKGANLSILKTGKEKSNSYFDLKKPISRKIKISPTREILGKICKKKKKKEIQKKKPDNLNLKGGPFLCFKKIVLGLLRQ